MTIPGPLAHLMKEEDELKALALKWIGEDDELSHHMSIIAIDMDTVWQAVKQNTSGEDARTIQLLGFRVFNHMGSALRLALGGYFQASAMLLRDLYETGWLINYLLIHPDKIPVWRDADDHKKRKEFEPGAIRSVIDKLDGFEKDARSRVYWQLCDFAAHPNAKGFALLSPPGEEARCGPFITPETLSFALHEIAKTFNVAAANLGRLLDMNHPETNATVRGMFVAVHEWNARFLDSDFTQAQRDKIASLER